MTETAEDQLSLDITTLLQYNKNLLWKAGFQ